MIIDVQIQEVNDNKNIKKWFTLQTILDIKIQRIIHDIK